MKKCGFLYYLCHIRTFKMKLKINAQPEDTKKNPVLNGSLTENSGAQHFCN